MYHKKSYWNPSVRKEGHFYHWICNLMQKQRKIPQPRNKEKETRYLTTTPPFVFLSMLVSFCAFYRLPNLWPDLVIDRVLSWKQLAPASSCVSKKSTSIGNKKNSFPVQFSNPRLFWFYSTVVQIDSSWKYRINIFKLQKFVNFV